MTAEWKHAHEFAEVAEVLKVKTTQVVMAAYNLIELKVVVLYSPDDTNHDRVVLVILSRDQDGVLQQEGALVEMPEFFRNLNEIVEFRLRQELGEPNHEEE